MTFTTLAVLALQAQANAALPPHSIVSYTGMPSFIEAPDSRGVRMVSHSVTSRLEGDRIVTETLTLFRNGASQPATLTLNLPVHSHITGEGYLFDRVSLSATLDERPLALEQRVGRSRASDRTDRRTGRPEWSSAERWHSARVEFPATGTRAIRTRFVAPPGRAGIDGALRLHAYDLEGARAWQSPLERLNFSIQDPDRVIFSVQRARPDFGWQIGVRGAFFRRDQWSPGEGTLVTFTYYPPSLGTE
jgi:hypothetical protein